MAEFNTYDILKQRYLILTREALATLKEQVKTPSRPAAPPRVRPPHRRADPWSPCVAPQNINDAARCWSRIRSWIRPMITEKATHLSERYNAYTFEVNPLATKTEIKEAIETLFNVKVEMSGPRTAAANPAGTG